MDDDLDRITDFIIKYSMYVDREKIKECVRQHLKYNTLIYVTDKKGKIAAVCRWNVEGTIAHVIDLMIREDYRNNGMIKTILTKGLIKYPYVTYLCWERGDKYPDRPKKYFSVLRMLT